MNDIIITYDETINSENRLKSIIRAIENNCEGYNEIVIVGDLPEDLQGVVHIGFSNAERTDSILKNQYRKLKAACISNKVTSAFYWVDADDYIIKFDATKATRISIPDGSPMTYKPKGTEKISFTHTENLMKRRGFGMNANFFNKFPMSFTKERLKNTFYDIDFETKYGYCIKTLYANFNRLPATSNDIEILNLTEYKTKSTYEKID